MIEELCSVLCRYDGNLWVYCIVEWVYFKVRVEILFYILCDVDLVNDNFFGKLFIL